MAGARTFERALTLSIASLLSVTAFLAVPIAGPPHRNANEPTAQSASGFDHSAEQPPGYVGAALPSLDHSTAIAGDRSAPTRRVGGSRKRPDQRQGAATHSLHAISRSTANRRDSDQGERHPEDIIHAVFGCRDGACADRIAAVNRVQRGWDRGHYLLDGPREQLTADLLFLMGAHFQVQGDLSRAADYFEAFAHYGPTTPPATETTLRDGTAAALVFDGDAPDGHGMPTPADDDAALPIHGSNPAEASGGSDLPSAVGARALENALAFRQALGQTDLALDDARAFDATYGETHIAAAARVSLRAATIHGAQGDDRAAIRQFQRYLSRYADHGPIDGALRAQVALGRILLRQDDDRAYAHFAAALRRWQAGAAGEIAATPEPTPLPSGMTFEATRDAVAEAAFMLAERSRRTQIGLGLPSYHGPSLPREVTRWAEAVFTPRLRHRMAAWSRADRAYAAAIAIGGPSWTVAAEARRGEMAEALAAELAAVRLPAFITVLDERVLAIYIGEANVDGGRPPDDEAMARPADLKGAIGDLLRRAGAAYARCFATAVRTRAFGPASERCATALVRFDPEHGPRLPEIIPASPLETESGRDHASLSPAAGRRGAPSRETTAWSPWPWVAPPSCDGDHIDGWRNRIRGDDTGRRGTAASA